MFYILLFSLIAIFLKPTSIYTFSFIETSEDISNFTRDTEQLSQIELASIVELSQENERDKAKDFVENAGHELAKVVNYIFGSNYVPMTESSSDTALPQDETNVVLEQESLSQNHESEFKESSEADLNHSPITTEEEPTHQIEIREKSEFFHRSGNELASSTPDNSFQEKFKADEDDFQPSTPEAIQVSEMQLIGSEEISELYESYGNEHALQTPEVAYHQNKSGVEDDLKPSDSEATQVSEIQLIEPREEMEYYQSSGNEHTSIAYEDAYQEKEGAGEDDFQPFDSEATQVSENQLIEPKEGLEYYQNAGNEHASIAYEDAYQEKERADVDYLQPSDSEATQVSESQLIEPKEILLYHDRTERSFTEINEETRLNPTGESLVLEADSTIESKFVVQTGTNDDINERTSLAETRENLTLELAGETELKLKEHAEAEYGFNFNEDNHLNQIGESNIRPLASNIELNPSQVEVKGSLKPIFQNVLNENSYINEGKMKKSVGRDENAKAHLFNSPVTKISQDNTDGLENRLFDHVSDIHSDGESELPLKLLQRTNNNVKNNLSNDFELLHSEAFTEGKIAVKENFIPSINANVDGNSEYSDGLKVGTIGSGNFSFPSENDKPVERSKHSYPTHDINNPLEADILIQNNTEQLTVENSHDLIHNSEAKMNERNRKEFVICESTDCLETATTIDQESADISSKLLSNIQIRDVDSDLGSAGDSKEGRNDSAHEENIEFNLHEVLQVIKADRNLRASVFNLAILYLPVLICDVLLWIVIIKLVRHIRHQIISNQQPEPTKSLDAEQNESEDVDRPVSARLSPRNKSRRSERDDGSEKDAGDDDFQDSSSEFLGINSKRKDWYPPS